MDDADRAGENIEERDAYALEEARRKAKAIPVGEPGECDYCGGTFSRIVNNACGHCRDKFKLG